MTELEKIQYLTAKYKASKHLYTVYSRTQLEGHYTFSLIYGTDKKKKVLSYIARKEAEGLFLIVYCANQEAQHSRCVFVSGMQNSLTAPAQGTASVTTSVTETATEVELPGSPAPLAPVKG